MPERARTVVTLRNPKGEYEVGVLAPLPPSLSLAELLQALEHWGGGSLDTYDWLSDQLYEATKRRYSVTSDLTTWEHGPGLGDAQITYEAVRITEEVAAGAG